MTVLQLIMKLTRAVIEGRVDRNSEIVTSDGLKVKAVISEGAVIVTDDEIDWTAERL